MCTYYRTIKNGSVKEFKFELDRNTYVLTNYQDITFYFTVEERFIHFTIDTRFDLPTDKSVGFLFRCE